MTTKTGIKSPKKKIIKKKAKKPVKKAQKSPKKAIKTPRVKIAQTLDDVRVDTSPTEEKKKRGRPPKKEIKVSIKSEVIDLTEREERFCREYVCDAALNATKAYQKAFPHVAYSTAKVNSCKLLTQANIKARIIEMKQERAIRLELAPERLLSELMKMAFYDPSDFYDDDGRVKPLRELEPDQRAIIAGFETLHKIIGDDTDGLAVTTKVKLPDKKACIELLGRYLKIFNESTPSPVKLVKTILEQVRDGKLSSRDAAYELQINGVPLPEILKIELSKAAPEEEVPENCPTPDEIEKRAMEAREAAQAQRDYFVPERRKEVQQMKEDMKQHESFGGENEH